MCVCICPQVYVWETDGIFCPVGHYVIFLLALTIVFLTYKFGQPTVQPIREKNARPDHFSLFFFGYCNVPSKATECSESEICSPLSLEAYPTFKQVLLLAVQPCFSLPWMVFPISFTTEIVHKELWFDLWYIKFISVSFGTVKGREDKISGNRSGSHYCIRNERNSFIQTVTSA